MEYLVTWHPPTRTKDGQGWEMQGSYWATDPADAVRQFRHYRAWIDFRSLTWVNAMQQQEPPRAGEGGGG